MVIGIVGRGRWGQTLERVFKEDPRVERVVVRGRSWEDLLDSRLSGVVVACQAAHHVEVARPFLEAGIPLFIEKPLALNRADAESLAEMAALRPSVPILVDHLMLFSELYARTRERALDSLGRGGTTERLAIVWTGDKKREDVSPLWDYGSHAVALSLDLLGPGISFAWTGSTSSNGDVSSFTIEGAGLRGDVTTGCVEEGRAPYRAVSLLMLESGVRRYSFWNETEKYYSLGQQPPIREERTPLTYAVQTFLGAIEGKPDRRLGLDLAVRVVNKLVGLERAAMLR